MLSEGRADLIARFAYPLPALAIIAGAMLYPPDRRGENSPRRRLFRGGGSGIQRLRTRTSAWGRR
ncbi:hypothetical protein BE08_35200 [Sorangium cellulosum]|uniref:Uncharacterized protein n=1 Tax=Sorangium cellulosum TaxID=56 RepID=A0A150PUT4_SORCE|nr:hypothetical protein BE08_35200 [Sorangium cellulosum]